MAFLGALATGLLLASVQDYRSADRALRRTRALAAAEAGLYGAMDSGRWDPHWSSTPHRGPIATHVFLVEDGPSRGVDSVTIWKTTRTSVTITSRVSLGTGPARAERALALTAALRAPIPSPVAALAARGTVRVGAQAIVNGDDSAMVTWRCPPPGLSLPAIAIVAPESLDVAGCAPGECFVGNPSVMFTPGAADEAIVDRIGGVATPALTALADPLAATGPLVPAPTLDSDGQCNVSDAGNFGDPLRSLGRDSPCADFFGIRHTTGDLHISGGAAQGTLVVDGDLTLDGNTFFAGLAIVRGTLHVSGDAHFVGAVVAHQALIDARAALRFSRCAIDRALSGAAVPVVAKGVTWTDIY